MEKQVMWPNALLELCHADSLMGEDKVWDLPHMFQRLTIPVKNLAQQGASINVNYIGLRNTEDASADPDICGLVPSSARFMTQYLKDAVCQGLRLQEDTLNNVFLYDSQLIKDFVILSSLGLHEAFGRQAKITNPVLQMRKLGLREGITSQ